MPPKAMMNSSQKPAFDNLYTPASAMESLVKNMDFNRAYSTHPVWECADPGTSKIAAYIRERGGEVISSDITTGVDFLKDPPPLEFGMIITNPPFSKKNQFLKRGYEYGRPFALLMPITALAGVARSKLYRCYGIQLLVLDQRIDFTGKGAPWFPVGWFCWKMLKKDLIFAEVR